MDKIESKHFLYLALAILLVIVLALFLGQRLSNISLGPLNVGFADNTAPTLTPAPPTEPPIDQDDVNAPTITAAPEETLDNGRSTPTTPPTMVPSDPPPPTGTPAPPSTDTPAAAPTVEDGVRNPAEPVPAGTPVLAGDLALGVDPGFELLQTADGSKAAVQIAVHITVRNRGDQAQLFTFTRDAITLEDNLGNIYAYASGKPPELNTTQQIQIAAGETFDLTGALAFDPAVSTSLPAFKGPVDPGASRLILAFEGFGPYNGLEITIDL